MINAATAINEEHRIEPSMIGTAAARTSGVTPIQSGYALVLMMLVMGMNQLDRGIVAILLDSIKDEMQLSDTMMALITGSGFAIIYTLAAIPLGRLADRYNRTRIIGVGIIFYSIMASCMGFAQNVTQLALARGAVAIGEASGSASSTSLISDYYPVARRARAMAIWGTGTYLGLFAGLIIGGELHQNFGWRTALWGTAAPGILLGILFLLTVKEPVRGASDLAISRTQTVSMPQTLRIILSQPSYRYLCGAFMSQAFVIYAFGIWAPSLLARVHHLDAAQVGLYSGLSKGLCGMFGVLGGGFLTQYVAGSRLRDMTTIPIIAALLLPPAMMIFLFSPSETLSLIGLFVGSFLLPVHQAPSVAMMHGIVRPQMRAFATTVAFIGISLGGLAFGPLLTGIISDILTPRFGADALRYALVIPTLAGFLTAIFLILARRNLTADSQKLLDD